jgi:hypothetical protein
MFLPSLNQCQARSRRDGPWEPVRALSAPKLKNQRVSAGAGRHSTKHCYIIIISDFRSLSDPATFCHVENIEDFFNKTQHSHLVLLGIILLYCTNV